VSQNTLGRRVLREHRQLVLTLTAALIVNILVYLVVVRPLSDRVANIAQRDAAAAQSLNAARKEHAAALGTLTGKDKASQELARFYKDVLPRDFEASRRLTHTRVPKIAKQFNVEFYSASVPPVTQARESSLTRYTAKIEMAGRYRDVRAFMHQLETAPEFVVIDDVSLSTDDTDGGLLLLTLQLSTYYRAAAE
jgi:Tfp pilus assembly protein PilO